MKLAVAIIVLGLGIAAFAFSSGTVLGYVCGAIDLACVAVAFFVRLPT